MTKWNQEKIGYLYTSSSYLLWGFLTLYWNALNTVSSMEILAHRILWGYIFVSILMFCQSKKRLAFFSLLNEFKINFLQIFYIFLAALAISLNWLLFIWAVNFHHIIEASLGLYITPIVSMILSVLVLKESVRKGTLIAMIMSFLGVLVITCDYGKIPWIAISLAVTSSIYGLLKKYIRVDALVGMCMETLMVAPFAFVFLLFLQRSNKIYFGSDIHVTLLLIGSGILTVLPLLWFTEGSKRISLTINRIFSVYYPNHPLSSWDIYV
ncbi:EamA family transporter RarD [Niallia sp. NCCP-28]|uniref:EamA family transporter RarD n=1 Tax=Niallia sp. NCCP-28 TaxID=2934712 RepID=UPI00208AD0F3|nr:EamA family transporter RarD [Niallia sp. NCCP-28]GKU85166.1 transporter [Niallia sp. NCCP-28]